MKFSLKKMLIISGLILWVQMTFAPLISVQGIMPDFIFLLAVFYVFEIDHHNVAWASFLIGACRDLMSSSFFGLETASLVGASLLLQSVAAQFNRRDNFIVIISTFLFTIAALALPALLMITEWGSGQLTGTLPRIFLTALYTSILAVGVFPVFRRLFGFGQPKRQYELFNYG